MGEGSTNWSVVSREGREVSLASPAGTVCPAELRAAHSHRFGLQSWFYHMDNKRIPDTTITVTCDPHTNILNKQ